MRDDQYYSKNTVPKYGLVLSQEQSTQCLLFRLMCYYPVHRSRICNIAAQSEEQNLFGSTEVGTTNFDDGSYDPASEEGGDWEPVDEQAGDNAGVAEETAAPEPAFRKKGNIIWMRKNMALIQKWCIPIRSGIALQRVSLTAVTI